MTMHRSAFTISAPPLSGGCSYLHMPATASTPGLRLWLNKPQGEAPTEGWPVLVVLDGESYFTATAEMVQRLSRRTAKTRISPMIVLGVAPEATQDRLEAYAFTSGEEGIVPKGAEVLKRLEDEVSDLLISEGGNPSRMTLVGHSMSGLFVLEARAARSRFSRYAAISPSIWWNVDIIAAQPDFADCESDLFVAVGALEENISSSAAHNSRKMITNAKYLKLSTNNNFRIVDDEDHGSVFFSIIPTVLRFATLLGSRG